MTRPWQVEFDGHERLNAHPRSRLERSYLPGRVHGNDNRSLEPIILLPNWPKEKRTEEKRLSPARDGDAQNEPTAGNR